MSIFSAHYDTFRPTSAPIERCLASSYRQSMSVLYSTIYWQCWRLSTGVLPNRL